MSLMRGPVTRERKQHYRCRCVPPHPSRYSLSTFSHLGEGFYCRAFVKLQTRTVTSMHAAIAPVARRCNRRRAGEARPKGKYSRGRMALAPIRTREFSLPRGRCGRWAAVPPSSFIQSTFTSQTGSLLLSLYAPRCCLTASAGFGRQFAKLRALSRLRRRYDSRK